MLPNKPDEALTPQERRQSDRKKLIVDVKFNGGDATGIANTRDIGIGGLYMTTGTDFENGEEVALNMTIGGEAFKVEGIIAYIDPGQGVGIRFKNLTFENVSQLKKELAIE
ncbi:MAG: PilZ domain-containing protein [Aridibacter sp.]